MLPVFWKQAAREDITYLLRQIGREDPLTARLFSARIEAFIILLSQHPHVYREGRVSGTYEILMAPHYAVVYCVKADRIDIVSILHTHQEYP